MFQFFRIRLVLAATVLSFAAAVLPVRADDVTASLAQASKLIDQGLPVKAIDLINQTLKSGKVPADLAAKGLLMRAQAQEKLAKYAYALADYNSALWMQSLSGRDKSEAEQGRQRIMSKLGVANSSESVAAAGTAKPSSKSAARPARSASWDTAVQTTPSEQQTSGIGSIFSGLFGASETSAQPQPESNQPAAHHVERARPTSAKVEATARIEPQAQEPSSGAAKAAGEPTGDFAIQMAALESEDKAIYEVNRIAKRYSEWLGGRTPSIHIKATSDGGTLYKVIAEPYQRGEGVATCELLKTKGLSCMLISK